MSRVTNAVLTFGCGEDEAAAIAAVNRELDPQGFVLTSGVEPQELVSGGSKNLECNIAIAAFNYVSDELLSQAIRSYPWEDPVLVHCFREGPDSEEGFSELRWRVHNRCPVVHPFSRVIRCELEDGHAGMHICDARVYWHPQTGQRAHEQAAMSREVVHFSDGDEPDNRAACGVSLEAPEPVHEATSGPRYALHWDKVTCLECLDSERAQQEGRHGGLPAVQRENPGERFALRPLRLGRADMSTERSDEKHAEFRQAVTAAAQEVARANQDTDADDYEDRIDRAVDALLEVCGLQICILCGEPTLSFDAAVDYCERCTSQRDQ